MFRVVKPSGINTKPRYKKRTYAEAVSGEGRLCFYYLYCLIITSQRLKRPSVGLPGQRACFQIEFSVYHFIKTALFHFVLRGLCLNCSVIFYQKKIQRRLMRFMLNLRADSLEGSSSETDMERRLVLYRVAQ